MRRWVPRGGSVPGAGAALAAALAAGAAAGVSLPAGVGVPAAYALAAVSLFARARTTSGRVRLRLLLFVAAVAGGGLHHLLAHRFPSSGLPSAGLLQAVVQLLAAAGIVGCLGLSVAGLLVAAADSGTVTSWIRRVLDGWMIAGSLITLGWVLLQHRSAEGGGVPRSVPWLARVVTDIVVLGLLVALRYCQHPRERTAGTLSAVALVLLFVSDTVRALPASAGTTWCGVPLVGSCAMAGLFLVAAVPWLPGGAHVMSVDQRMMPVVGVVASFVPVAVCALALAAHTLAGGRVDVGMMVVAGSVLVALGVRQAVVHADHLRVTSDAAAQGERYRTLVDGSRDVITIAGLDCRVRYTSPAAFTVFGYRPEDLVGAPLPLYCHPQDLPPLRQAIENLLREARSGIRGPVRYVSCRVLAADGQWRHVESTIGHHPEGMIFSSRDVTERTRRQEQLERLAYHDTLTGLANRGLFADRVAHALRKRSVSTHPPAVLFLDLDGFKSVNDSLGHAAGDALLVHAARRLRTSVRDSDTVARLGGDEFAVLLEAEAGTCPPPAMEVAERILSALTVPYRVGGTSAAVSASIGIAVAAAGMTPEQLLHHADQAMYAAKAAGKRGIRVAAELHLTLQEQSQEVGLP